MGFSLKSLATYDPLRLSAHENNKLRRQETNFAAQKAPVVSHLSGSFSVVPATKFLQQNSPYVVE